MQLKQLASVSKFCPLNRFVKYTHTFQTMLNNSSIRQRSDSFRYIWVYLDKNYVSYLNSQNVVQNKINRPLIRIIYVNVVFFSAKNRLTTIWFSPRLEMKAPGYKTKEAFTIASSYGDKVPKSIASRLLSIIWILYGTVLIGLMTVSFSTALTVTIVVTAKEVQLYGSQVGRNTKSQFSKNSSITHGFLSRCALMF